MKIFPDKMQYNQPIKPIFFLFFMANSFSFGFLFKNS